jgi:hypothetical protein
MDVSTLGASNGPRLELSNKGPTIARAASHIAHPPLFNPSNPVDSLHSKPRLAVLRHQDMGISGHGKGSSGADGGRLRFICGASRQDEGQTFLQSNVSHSHRSFVSAPSTLLNQICRPSREAPLSAQSTSAPCSVHRSWCRSDTMLLQAKRSRMSSCL